MRRNSESFSKILNAFNLSKYAIGHVCGQFILSRWFSNCSNKKLSNCNKIVRKQILPVEKSSIVLELELSLEVFEDDVKL